MTIVVVTWWLLAQQHNSVPRALAFPSEAMCRTAGAQLDPDDWRFWSQAYRQRIAEAARRANRAYTRRDGRAGRVVVLRTYDLSTVAMDTRDVATFHVTLDAREHIESMYTLFTGSRLTADLGKALSDCEDHPEL